GGDIGRGTAYGAGFGFASGALASAGQVNIFGRSNAWAGTANYVTTAALRNSIISGAYTAFAGGDIGRAMAEGFLQGGAAGLTNSVIGHALGHAFGGAGEWDPNNGVFVYRHGVRVGAITFGNVIVGDSGTLSDPDIYKHEVFHAEQGMTLSVGYVFNPRATDFWSFWGAHPWALAASYYFTGNTHKADALECVWQSVPVCD